MISIIVAVGENNIIGSGGDIPWHLPSDFAHFKKVTTGHPVIMGMNTFVSIGRPLPGRTNIVLTNSQEGADGCLTAQSLNEALRVAQESDGGDEVFVIGGAFVYAQAIDLAERLYVTFIHGNFDGDKFFPEINLKKWKEVSRRDEQANEQNQYDMDFVVFQKLT